MMIANELPEVAESAQNLRRAFEPFEGSLLRWLDAGPEFDPATDDIPENLQGGTLSHAEVELNIIGPPRMCARLTILMAEDPEPVHRDFEWMSRVSFPQHTG
jgi:hypothetical protein